MQRTHPDELRSVAAAVVEGLGGTTAIARDVADHLVGADLRGHNSHGVRMLPIYAGLVEQGTLVPDRTPTVETVAPGCVQVDGRRGFGQLAGREAVAAGVEQSEGGLALVGVGDTTHVGRVGEYGERAAEAGRLFVALVNVPAVDGPSFVAPLGSTQGRLGTNPVCFGVPSFDVQAPPVVVDMATSQVAVGKVRLAAAAGHELDPEWTTDEDGEPIVDPDAFLEESGAILPTGGRTTGHKGFGLAVMAELFGGIVGDGFVSGQSDVRWGNHAAFFFADPTAFATRDAIEAKLRAFRDHLAGAEYSDAVAAGRTTRDDRGVLPGTPEYRTAETNRREGIPMPPDDLADLGELADDVGAGDVVPADWSG